MATLKPWPSSRHPIEAEARPFPRDETTPPVTKMHLADPICPRVLLEERPGSLEILGCVDGNAHRSLDGDDSDPHPVVERTELLEGLGLLEWGAWESGEAKQRLTAIG